MLLPLDPSAEHVEQFIDQVLERFAPARERSLPGSLRTLRKAGNPGLREGRSANTIGLLIPVARCPVELSNGLRRSVAMRRPRPPKDGRSKDVTT